MERPRLPAGGNLQADAREARYAAAEGLRVGPGPATGSRPGTRAPTWPRPSSTGSRPRRGAGRCSGSRRAAGVVIRPLLGLGREQGAGAGRARRAALPRRPQQRPARCTPATGSANEVMPVLEEIGPAAEETIAETQAELREEAEALERLAAEALEAAGARPRAVDRRRRPGRARPRGPAATPCGPWPSGPRAARWRSGASARPRSGGWPGSPRAGWWSSAAASRLASSTATSASPAGPRRSRRRPR